MIILGRTERGRRKYPETVQRMYDRAAYHDGRWSMITPENGTMADGLTRLPAIRRRPKRGKA